MKLKKLKENNDNIILSLKNEIKQITDKNAILQNEIENLFIQKKNLEIKNKKEKNKNEKNKKEKKLGKK